MTFSISVSLSGLESKLSGPVANLANKAATAVNDAALSLIDNAITEIGQQTDLPPAIVANEIAMDRANTGNPTAEIRVAERFLPMSLFRPVQFRGGVAANMRINRGVQFIPGAFITTRLGSRQVFLPIGPRLQVVFGPSTANLFEDAAELHLDSVKNELVSKL